MNFLKCREPHPETVGSEEPCFLVVDLSRWWRRVVHRLANLWTGEFFIWQAAICLEQRLESNDFKWWCQGLQTFFALNVRRVFTPSNLHVLFIIYIPESSMCVKFVPFYPKNLPKGRFFYIFGRSRYIYVPELPSSHMRLVCGTI